MKTITQSADVGIIVARFQCPFLHEGHLEIINNVMSNHPRTIIFLGLSPLKCSYNNPFDFTIRKEMIEEVFPNVEILYIEDVGDNGVWSSNLDRLISRTLGPNSTALLYGSRDSFINSYKGKYPTLELIPNKIISASEIRKQIGIKVKHTLDFRIGIVHALQNQFPSCKPTVDTAIVNFSTNELLLARKPNQTLLRFPGGFMDPALDKSAEDAAIREAKEETNLITKVRSYIGSTICNDVRYRSEPDKIMTFLFAMSYEGGEAIANDDIEFVCWKSIDNIQESDIVNGHRPLLKMFNEWYSKNK